MSGEYHTRTDKEGHTKIMINGVLHSPEKLDAKSPHYAYWVLGSTKISSAEQYVEGYEPLNPQGKAVAMMEKSHLKAVHTRTHDNQMVKKYKGLHWSAELKPELNDKKMFWYGERPFYHKDAFLQLKFGLTHMQMYFEFYSSNKGLTHYGRSDIMPLVLDNGHHDLSVWTHKPEKKDEPKFP